MVFAQNEMVNVATGKDICLSELVESTMDKGTLMWPDTLVGSRRAVLCPYAYIGYSDPIYVDRDCTVYINSTTGAVSTEWGYFFKRTLDTMCPYPPFTDAVMRLKKLVRFFVTHFPI